MELISFEQFIKNNNDKIVCALGQFDGFHLGHKALIEEVIKVGKTNNLKKVILTFHPHPMFVLRPDQFSFELMTLTEKKDYLSNYDIDYLVYIPFSKEFADLLPIEFVNNYLLKLNASFIVCGYDFSFGRNGTGKAKDISLLSNNLLKTIIIDKVTIKGEKVASTNIRKFLQNGNIEEANALLGYPYQVSGQVIHGRGVGKKIDLPTMNVEVKNHAALRLGVYAVNVLLNDKIYKGMLNIGHNPSFNYTSNLSFEVHLFDYSEDAYDQYATIIFYKFIRDEQRFNSLEDFLNQIKKDKISVKNVLE